jgi:hypothetical protein
MQQKSFQRRKRLGVVALIAGKIPYDSLETRRFNG